MNGMDASSAMEPWAVAARERVKGARLVVVKIGTAVLTGGGDQIDRAYVHDLAAQVAAMARGDSSRRFIIVSSGAGGAGVGALGLAGKPTDVSALQAAAAAGQPLLMSLWREAFEVRRVPAAQILLSRGDFDSRERYLNVRNCIHQLHALGAIPIVNENDTVATEEISLGDNDGLAAKVAVAVQAEALVILTTGPGVLDAGDNLVRESADAASLARHVRPVKTSQGRGGMATKVQACRDAAEAGIPTVIAPGRPVATLTAVLVGERVGTCCAAADDKRLGRRNWIAAGATPAGGITLDAGAARAVLERGASLLAKGVTAVDGSFEVGDVVSLRDAAGKEIARGLCNLTRDELRAVLGRRSDELESILGRRVHEEVVHRDNLVVM
jgi:glutamate 5-kinase